MIVTTGGRKFAVNAGTMVTGVVELMPDAPHADVVVVAKLTPLTSVDSAIIDVRKYFYDTDADIFRATGKGLRLDQLAADALMSELVHALHSEPRD